MSLSIRRRLAVWIAVALIVTLGLVFLTLRFTLRSVLDAEISNDISADLAQVSAQLAATPDPADQGDLQRIVQSVSFVLVIRDPEGRELAATPGIEASSLALAPEEISRVIAGGTVEREAELGGEPVRVQTARLMVGRQLRGIVQVGEDASALQDVTATLERVFLLVGVGALLLMAAVGYWLSRSALKPIDDVTAVAREIQASDLSRRIAATRKPQEVQQLADTFDAMLDRLSRAFEQQRTFVMDMSHELRTPLTALRGNLDVLLMDEGVDSGVREQLERMSREVGRLIRLTSNLLYLAHVDAGRGIDRRPVALDDLCLEVQRQAKDLRPDVRLRLGREDQATVMGDRDLLKQLILNLVDNAMKYTPAGGDVTLSLYCSDGWSHLEVKDTGPGIPSEELPHIFDRYYRGAGHEGRGHGGAGIGLAITEWVARSHGGRVEVQSEPGKGSTFTVHLPLDSGPASS